MGLFNNLLGKKAPLEIESPAEAINNLVFMATTSNGQLSDERAELWMATAKRMRIMKGNSEQTFQKWMNKLDKMLNNEGWEPTMTKCTTILPPELKPTVFAICCDLLHEGQQLSENENNYLKILKSSLGIEDQIAESILKVIQIKNNV